MTGRPIKCTYDQRSFWNKDCLGEFEKMMNTLKTRDPEATRTALLDAAEDLFLRKGFGNTALSEIAKRAELTKSLIHHYFGSKEGLWREVKMRRFMQYAEKQMEMLKSAEPTVDLLRASISFYFDYLKKNPQMVRILAWMFLERDQEECVDKDRELIEIGVSKLKQAQAAGKLRKDIDPRFILFTFIGLAQHWFQDKNHFVHDFGLEGLPQDLDDAYLQAMTKIFFDGILEK